MSHLFPPRRLRNSEVADPDYLNEAFQPIAGKIAGGLGEHDISSQVKTAPLTVAAEAYYDGHQIKRAADPGWARGGGVYYGLIDGVGAQDDVAVVEDSTGWQPLQDQTGSQEMSLSITCGEGDILVMFGQTQHVAWSGTDTNVAADINTPLKLQYAFRVDGAIQDASITGAAVWPDPPPQQWYRATPAGGAGGEDYDYRHIQYVQNTLGIAPAVHPCRIVWSLPVVAGSHTVEVLARRLPMSDMKLDTNGSGTTVQVFNRRLFVLRIKGMSPHTGDAPSVNITAIEDGDVIDAADITTNGFTVLQTAVNALGSAALERGALRNEHLPSVIYGPVATPLTPSSAAAATYTGAYPGYGTNSAGWGVVNDGAGNNLRITGPTAGEWDLATYPGVFIVLANVQVNYIAWIAGMAGSASIEGIACFALRMTNAAGTVTVLGETEVYVNGHNFNNEATNTYENIEDDIPLMWVVDSTTLSANDKHITRVEVVCSTWNGASGGAATVQVATQRGCIFGFVLKGVAL